MAKPQGAPDYAALEKYIKWAETLCETCRGFSHIQGSSKLLKKCTSDMKFLRGVSTFWIFDFDSLNFQALCVVKTNTF